MSTVKRFILTSALLGLGIASTAFADGSNTGSSMPHPHGERLARFDANRDGSIDAAEIDKTVAEMLKDIDGDRDGFITAEEIKAHHERMRAQRAAERHARMDANRDGRISVAEFQSALKQRLLRRDRNGDGVIASDEWARPRQHGQHRGSHPAD